MAQRFFLKHGIETAISDAGKLHYERSQLLIDNASIDVAYNRLVDFAFERPEHEALRAAYQDSASGTRYTDICLVRGARSREDNDLIFVP